VDGAELAGGCSCAGTIDAPPWCTAGFGRLESDTSDAAFPPGCAARRLAELLGTVVDPGIATVPAQAAVASARTTSGRPSLFIPICITQRTPLPDDLDAPSSAGEADSTNLCAQASSHRLEPARFTQRVFDVDLGHALTPVMTQISVIEWS